MTHSIGTVFSNVLNYNYKKMTKQRVNASGQFWDVLSASIDRNVREADNAISIVYCLHSLGGGVSSAVESQIKVDPAAGNGHRPARGVSGIDK